MITQVAAYPSPQLSSKIVVGYSLCTQKIANFAKQVFAFFKAIFCFPLRYLGAKDWSLMGKITGIDLNLPYKPHLLSKEEAKTTLKYAAACAFTDGEKEQWIAPLGYKEIKSLRKVQGHLNIKVIQKDDEVMILFGSIKAATPKDLLIKDALVAKNLLGGVPAIYQEACKETQKILADPLLANKNVKLVGHCFGGSLATYTGLKLSKQVVSLNSFPLGAGLQWDLGNKALKQAESLVYNVSAKTDWVSDNRILNIFDRILSFASIRTPGIFGKRNYLPTAYNNCIQSHLYILGCYMQHLGFHKRTHIHELSKEFLATL